MLLPALQLSGKFYQVIERPEQLYLNVMYRKYVFSFIKIMNFQLCHEEAYIIQSSNLSERLRSLRVNLDQVV